MENKEAALKEAINFLEMNAYEGSNAKTILRMGDIHEVLKPIRKLVDKATPKKPCLSKIWKDEDTKTIYDEYGHINEMLCVCPNCEESTILDYEYDKRFEHCSSCGQAIDWSDEDGK